MNKTSLPVGIPNPGFNAWRSVFLDMNIPPKYPVPFYAGGFHFMNDGKQLNILMKDGKYKPITRQELQKILGEDHLIVHYLKLQEKKVNGN